MSDREMDDLIIFAYSTASARARREQAKAIRQGARRARAWITARIDALRHARGTTRLDACTGCQS